MNEEPRGPDDPNHAPPAAVPSTDVAQPHPLVLTDHHIVSGYSPAPDEAGFAWSYVVLVSVLAVLGCGTALVLVLLGGVSLYDATRYVLWLIGGVVVILSARRLGLLRRLGNGLAGFINGGGQRQ